MSLAHMVWGEELYCTWYVSKAPVLAMTLQLNEGNVAGDRMPPASNFYIKY